VSRISAREHWITEVLRSDLNNSVKLILVALGRQMDEKGRVRYPRERLAADVGLKTVQRVTDRIKEAKDAGYLIADGGGINGTVAQYYASLPATPLRGTSSTGRGNGSRGTRNGVPEPADLGGPGTPSRGGIRARGTYKNRDSEPAPVGSRVEREHSLNSKAAVTGEWAATRVTSLPSVPRTEVA
jgi:hypothetical protein